MRNWLGFKGKLEGEGISTVEGLSDLEISEVERKWRFEFPPDLRLLLGIFMPIGTGFPDWRGGDEDALRSQLEAPIEGVLFDVFNGAYWHQSWGPRPARAGEARELAAAALAHVPRLVPLWGHRYLPEQPAESNNPVLSVVQTDIIIYASDLLDYFDREFLSRRPWHEYGTPESRRVVPFWSDVVAWNNAPFA